MSQYCWFVDPSFSISTVIHMQSIFAKHFDFAEIFAHAIKKTPQCHWHRWFWLHGVINTAMSSSTVSLTQQSQKWFKGTVSWEFWPPFLWFYPIWASYSYADVCLHMVSNSWKYFRLQKTVQFATDTDESTFGI